MDSDSISEGSLPTSASIGEVVRARRRQLRLSVEALADAAQIAKSYISQIENDRRQRPPSEAVLDRLERALDLPPGRLLSAARWQAAHPQVREEARRLRAELSRARPDTADASDRAAALSELRAILGRSRLGDAGAIEGGIDESFRSGQLRALIDRLAPAPGASASAHADVQAVPLPLEVPLINKVAAGYPRDFTDLGYPARVADEYVRCPDLRDADAFAARVVGDSMEPDYREGDIVVFSPAKTLKSGMDCFARLEPDQESTFKRAYFETGSAGEELIRLQPLNPRYPPRVLRREQVAGLYAAVSVMRWV